MKIAVTYGAGQVFQHFGHCEAFKIYTTDGTTVVDSQVVSAVGSGHGALSGFLNNLGVEALICGGIGGGAQTALKEMNIAFYPGVSGDADASVAAFLAGTLAYNPNATCGHHHHADGHDCGSEGHSCGEDKHGCSGH